jgi:hypothetical protein
MAKRKRDISGVVRALVKQHGKRALRDVTDGATACAAIWDFSQGGMAAFRAFAEKYYLPPGAEKQQLALRLDHLWRVIVGSMTVIRKETRAALDIADLPFGPAEELLGAYSPSSHLEEDFHQFQIAQLVQLNFGTDRRDIPRTREGWVARRLSDWGRTNVPAGLKAHASKIQSEVDRFVSGYNLHLDKIDFGNPDVRFPKGTRAISHWGLRDYMMQLYGTPHGLEKQRAILSLMECVVDGKIPEAIIDAPTVVWKMQEQKVISGGKGRRVKGHGPLRWQHFRKLFHAMHAIDPHRRHGNMIDEKFLGERELPEARVRGILTSILGSPVARRVGGYLAGRLERPLEPFDLYFKDFLAGAHKPPLSYSIQERYPHRDAVQAAIPKILRQLGFSRADAEFISTKIRVDNGRSAGHAWSPGARHDLQLLRVRVPPGGMNEIEFSTFMHELGHCVEGVLSSFRMDYNLLWSVPNSALTEAFAFTFQDRADEILGRRIKNDDNVVTLQRFWEAFEIAGPALVEMDFFHWLYQHPKASAAQMQKAIRTIGDDIWARYHAKIFGTRSFGLLSVYSHILWCDLYLADYPLGYVAAYQIRQFLKRRSLGKEMPRICATGSVYPDVWMQTAVGRPIEATPLLRDTAAALKALSL